MEHEVRILADGKELPLAPFVERLVGNTIAGLVGSLKGAEEAKEITIVLRDARGE